MVEKQKQEAEKFISLLEWKKNYFNCFWYQVQRSTMDDRTVDTIFQGSLENLPPVSSKIVRIFTSSTFTGKFWSKFYVTS